jgi:histidine triad (HIT) family protein
VTESSCFICAKHQQGEAAQDGVIFSDEIIYVGHIHALDRPQAYRGYLMVEPIRHVASLGDLTDEESSSIGRMVNRLARILKDVEDAEHVYSFIFGDAVAHLHVHVAPRYPGTPPEYRGARLREWPETPRVGVDEMRVVSRRLAEALKG